MKEIEISIKIRHYQLEELPEEERELVNTAIKATDNAYADYSHFYVGAALRLSDGTVVIGANQENAAYPSGLCAERTAIFAAQANHPDKHITCLAIAARNDNGLLKSPITPCGACRVGTRPYAPVLHRRQHEIARPQRLSTRQVTLYKIVMEKN